MSTKPNKKLVTLSTLKKFKKNFEICAITNDIYTKEDAKILSRSGVLDNKRINFNTVSN